MRKVHTPPIPKNKNLMIYMILALVLLFIVVLLLVGDLLKKPREEKEIQSQIASVEAEIKAKQQNLDKSSWKEAKNGGNITPPPDTSVNNNFTSQEKELSEHTLDEADYLKERRWGFWYIVFPLFIIIAAFIFWVARKHKKWMR